LVEIREREELYDYELERVKEIHEWFNIHLKKPATFARSTNSLFR
jgi:hypothetical protein